eukprot:CAMPEP_0172078620 /NCGR_PEP_ID=MMETSP1043-20130122/17724_1 /TAXON_ID=464988 /ORGANISM="Hemiselmis andersenii, Strain CCMP441" /LENGTH=173 /DNA_ID=CAMNT_0012739723 /DNA_START=15 /DNA_END=535 /DNA_ORIENTATION=-
MAKGRGRKRKGEEVRSLNALDQASQEGASTPNSFSEASRDHLLSLLLGRETFLMSESTDEPGSEHDILVINILPSTPFEALLSKRLTQVWISSLGLVCFGFMALSLRTYEGMPSYRHPFLRADSFLFTAMELRNGSTGADIRNPGIASFGLLLEGASLPEYMTLDATTEFSQT